MTIKCKLNQNEIIELCKKHIESKGYRVSGDGEIIVDTIPGDDGEESLNVVSYEVCADLTVVALSKPSAQALQR